MPILGTLTDSFIFIMDLTTGLLPERCL